MFGPSPIFFFFFEVLWPLLTSHSSLLLRFGYHLLIALSGFGLFAALHVCEISPGTHTFFHPYTRHVYRKRFRAAIGLWLVWQSYPRLQPDIIPVRRARVLPLPSFRFRFTTDTLGFGCDLPAAGRSRDFHPLECALAGRTEKYDQPLMNGLVVVLRNVLCKQVRIIIPDVKRASAEDGYPFCLT